MSRNAALMTDVACVVIEAPQSTVIPLAVGLNKEASSVQPPLPTLPLATATKPQQTLPRDQKRKAFYYNNIQKNSNHRTQPSNKWKKLGQRRVVLQEAQPHRPCEGSEDIVESRSRHAQSSFNTNLPSQRPGGPLYTGQIAQITNNYYYISPEQAGQGAVPPLCAAQSNVPWARPVAATAVRAPPTMIELQGTRPINAAIGVSFGANDIHGLVAGSQAERRSEPQAQPFSQPVVALTQQQGFGTSPRRRGLMSSSPVHRHVGIDILPSIKRSQTLPTRHYGDCSKSV